MHKQIAVNIIYLWGKSVSLGEITYLAHSRHFKCCYDRYTW